MVADSVPESVPLSRRLRAWLEETSDLRLSVYMLIVAFLIASALLLIDARLLGA